MATKWKGWTARLPVKICCVVLAPVMAFIFLLGALGLAQTGNNFDSGIIFADFRNSDFFYDTYIPIAAGRVQTVFDYRSEEHIRGMGLLEWQLTDDYYGSGDREGQWLCLVSANITGMWQSWGTVHESDLESAAAKQMLEGAINSQLNTFHEARKWLDTTGGLYYYIADETRSLTNSPEQHRDFFRLQPVHMLAEKGRVEEQSRQGNGRYYRYYDIAENTTVYIAFSREAVDYWNAIWRVSQRQIIANIALMAAPAVAAFILLIILMAGAGRRYGDDGGDIRFTALDKPWLDLGLTALIAYEAAICSAVYYSANVAWRYDNIRWIVLLCAVLSAGFMLPLLGWLMSFAKRCKAGKWWRHTMIYALFSSICGGCKRLVQSLWAGVPLTAKVIAVGFAASVQIVISAADPKVGVSFGGACVVAATVLMLRYARRLRLVEQGAAAVSSGIYDKPIPVTGGELGSIATSINRISDGINAAVTERMKSERLKTELITNVSHDIRTPLTSLITYTDLLKTEGLSSEKAPEYLEVLIQKSARLKALTDDLFEASKAASGNIEVHLESLDLSDFVRQVLGELDERVRESGLDFRMNLPEHAPVRADGKLLWRVLENLISNVFKYALGGSRVYVDVVPEDGEYRLEVKNISEQPLNLEPSELTERFKRGDGARSDDGSGLGLSIAQSFVQAQGGKFGLSIDGDLFKATIRLPGRGER